jgi:type 2 lantibiotic biosynthesis protein LanM
MGSPQDELTRLVERAAFLHERRAPTCARADLTPADRARAQDKVLRWKKAVANGNDTLFARRLHWEALQPEDAAALFSGERLTDTSSLPLWATCLDAVLKAVPRMAERKVVDYQSAFPFLNAKIPVAFEHLLAPFVEYATGRLPAVASSPALLHNQALIDLQRFLLVELGECAITCLMVEFSAFRALKLARTPVPAGRTASSAAAAEGHSVYDAFIQRMWTGRFAELCHQYPVLARFLAETTEMWIQFVSEFLERLQADYLQLQEMLSISPLGKVTRIQAGLSDRHNHGRVVLSLHFESGAAVIYKPKDLASEKAYQVLMKWLNQHHSPLCSRTFAGLYRNGYGWVETISPTTCETREQVQRFYFRAGALLSLFHAIGGSDCHSGNLFACGEYPLLIDMETILSSELLPVPGIDTASQLVNRDFWDWSVFRTAMLPRWIAERPEQADVSAGLADMDSLPASSVRYCESPNTDQMKIAEKQVPGRAMRNAPYLNGRAVPAREHVEDIVAGFREMYTFLLASKDLMLGPGGPLDCFADLPLRFVFRNTYIYATLIAKIRRPECLRDGVDASIQAEALYKYLLHSAEKPLMWELAGSEVEGVLRGDVPIFSYRSSSTFLELDGNRGSLQCFVQPAADGLKRRFLRLSPADQELQVCYVRSVFGSRGKGTEAAPHDESVLLPASFQENPSWKDAALMIAREIQKSAKTGDDGTVTWVTRVFDPKDQSWKLRPMDARLYDGLTGTALFLAALEKAAETRDFHGLLVGALKMLKIVVPTLERRSRSDQFSIGAGIGLGSIVYGLAKIADLLAMEEALELAQTYARFLTPLIIKADTAFDLMSGAGGSILALLALHKLTGGHSLLELARECGDHLLANRSVSDSGLRSWKTVQGKMLAGYSHGAAGLSHALIELHRATGLEQFSAAAIEACSFENTLFSKQKGNWPNLTGVGQNGQPAFWNTWCHGAVGIGLGRMACLDVPEVRVQSDIEEALKTTLLEKFAALDHPCCGNMGRVELFLCAVTRFGRSAYLEKAHQIADSVVARAQQNGHYGLGTDKSFSSPSFHQGTAGIGYQLLRLASPQSLPCVLLWQ